MDLTFLNGKSEIEIEQILVENPSLIQEGFQIKGRQENIVTGRYDLFGIDKENNYVVIEVKKGRASEMALPQIARYMGLIKEKLNLKKEELHGIIFCQKASTKLKYALSVVDTIRLIEFGDTDTDSDIPKTNRFIYQIPEFIEVFKSDLKTSTAKVDLAGIPKENISVKAAKHSIKLTIITDDPDEPEEREIYFPRQIDSTQVTAKYNDGLLTIYIQM